MEDALLTPESFSILSGAGLIDTTADAPIYVHTTSQIEVEKENTIVLPQPACWNRYNDNDEYYHKAADIFIMTMKDGEIAAEPCVPAKVEADHMTITCYSHAGKIEKGDIVLVDYYVKRTGGASTIEITADKFGGNYYLEADTLFRRESDGVDMPAEFIIPNCKVQSNFTFSMASSGDPSTFTFTMDAFPDYTKFDQTHKVLAAIQVISDADATLDEVRDICQAGDAKAIELVGASGADSKNKDKVSFTYDNDSTEMNTKITAVGLDAEKDYNQTTFGKDPGVNVIQMNFKLPLEEGKTYRVKHYNPVFAKFQDQEGVKREGDQWLKDKTYTKEEFQAEPKDTLEVLVSELRGPISISVFEVGEKGASAKLVKTIDIRNQVYFKEDAE